MSRAWAFAYGSLVSAQSASETLGRAVEPLPAALHGWRRGWTLGRDNERAEKRFERLDGVPIAWCLALDLQREEGGLDGSTGPQAPNGALLELSHGDLERLDRREIRYDRVEIGESVELADGTRPGGPVYAWTAKPQNHFPEPPPGAVVLASYVEAVEAAFDALGAGHLDRFRSTTAEPRCEVVAARLAAGDSIAPGNPRRW
ncbi:gamma-glutamylcyclotransferase [Thermoleophilia bacterium SCSIO 60948]|nr:gamma-glutamylcyclotransferase [Thermoleophilia bacterium SCSIO 60948]